MAPAETPNTPFTSRMRGSAAFKDVQDARRVDRAAAAAFDDDAERGRLRGLQSLPARQSPRRFRKNRFAEPTK